ncbi:MAG: serine/threonine-protein kinase [Polyangiaceae bacterium]
MEAEGGDSQKLLGTILAGRYKITELLGEGGMGCVYVGEQQMGTNVRKVAVKTLHKHLSQDPKIKERFARECGTVSELHHPNTIQVFDYGTTPEGLLYIVMEFIKGQSVASVLEKTGPMPLARVEKILTQVCGSLQEAHEHGIVHRDLKPDNVVLCDRAGQTDWVEVLDFGIAKRSSENDPNEAKLTQQGMVLGTPPYMSPEQFTGQPIDARSDIYALGVMTYEMLTGQLPFEANTAWEWATKHMTAQPKPIEAAPNGQLLPEKVRQTIMRALEKAPQARFASAKEFVESLTTGGGPVITGQNAAATPAPVSASDPSSGGRAPVKTEMGAPMVAPGAMGAPMGPPPGAPMGAVPMGPPMGAPPMGAPPVAAVPMAPPRGEPEKKSNTGMLLGIAGGLAVVVIIILVIALKPGGNKTPVTVVPTATATPSAADTGTAQADNTPPTDTAGGDHPPLGGGTPPLGGTAQAAIKPGTPGTPTKPATTGTTKPSAPIPTPAPGQTESPMCQNAKKSGNAAMIQKFCGKK